MKIFLAEENGKTVGFAADRAINNDSALFENARKWGCGRGFKQIIVRTEQNNERAISFYKSKGFVEAERTIEDIFGSKVAIVTLKHDLTK
ncbi:MAG TPA: GNAT family N-acetyltransferase [Nitrososphaerales archaeon]|nr:GNAT family N-acetyltransferase [Nitrososphaerales archaeon]